MKTNPLWTKGLNEEQKAAVECLYGPLLILAGAGSGKTTVLVSRTGNMLEQKVAKPEEICVLTFTNKAARELVHRVGVKLGPVSKKLWTGTFHSFGLQILRKFHEKACLPSSFGILDSGDAQGLVKELLLEVKNIGKDSYKVETLLSMISDWRGRGQTKAKDDDDYQIMTEALLPKYLKRLELLGVVDFDSLILRPLELFEEHKDILEFYQNKFKFVMVDEFQDTSHTQFKLIEKLVAPHQNIAVVGDDDQSIYGWRGAEISNILDFPKKFKKCEVIKLERNYRSTPAILEVANEVIRHNEKRHGKALKPDPLAAKGIKPELFFYENEDVETEEVMRHIHYFTDQGYKYRDIAILYRSNGQGGMLETLLRQNQIPYVLTGGTGFFDRKESKDLLSYLRCAIRPNEIAFRRIMNVPSRGLGEVTVKKIEEFHKKHKISFIEASQRADEIEGLPHGAADSLKQLWNLLHNIAPIVVEHKGYSASSEAFSALVKQIGYDKHIRSLCKDDQSFIGRWMAVEVLGRSLDRSFERHGHSKVALLDFIDSMELREVVETPHRDEVNEVQLLTLHASKGLEFPVVIIIGIEEEIIPHRILGQDISEERRLFYVGVTRAKERLILSASKMRKRYGKWVPSSPSRFLVEIPNLMLERFEMGMRPVNETQKKDLLAGLFAKLDKVAATQKINEKS